MGRIAEFVLRHKLLVTLGWLAVLFAGLFASGKTSDRLVVDFSLPGQPSTEAGAIIQKEFGNGGDSWPLLATVTMPAGQAITGNEKAVARTFAALEDTERNVRVVDEAATGDRAFRTADDRTAYAYVFYPFEQTGSFTIPDDRFLETLGRAAPPGAQVGLTGEDALAVGEEDPEGAGVLIELLAGALGALAVLAFVFASFLAFVPLVIAAFSILATFLMLLPLTYVTDVSFIVQFLVALVGLGVAIDYSLLLVTRWREERAHGRDNHAATVVAMETAGHAVVFSGVTVAIGLLAIILLPVPFMRGMGIGGALIPLASVACTLTLLPVILGSIGPRIDWPRVRHEDKASRSWSRWAAFVVRRRWLAAGSALVVLGLLIVAFFGIRIGLPTSESLAKSGPAHESLQTLRQGQEPAGVITPLEIVVKTPDAAAVAQQVASVDGIADVFVPTDASSVKEGHTIVVAVPDVETVNSNSMGAVNGVIDRLEDNDAVLGITGIGPIQSDFVDAVYGNFPLMLTIIALLTFVLLARAFRSLLLPLKAVVLNLISLAAVYGVMTLFWQHGYGSDEIFGIQETGAITFWVPMMIFAFLYGLSMDYEVFILARVREEYDAARSTNAAVIEGIGRTGRLVTCAALILFLAFAALASGPGTDIKLLATGLGFGILIDATIVRSLLVPSLVSLFGKWNWWLPPWAAKALRVEPSIPHEEVDEPREPVRAAVT